MSQSYSQNGVALAGTPLARLCEALPRDEAATDVPQVYVGDLRDVMASVGASVPSEIAEKAASNTQSIQADELRELCERALRPAEPKAVAAAAPVEPPPKEQVLRAGHAKK